MGEYFGLDEYGFVNLKASTCFPALASKTTRRKPYNLRSSNPDTPGSIRKSHRRASSSTWRQHCIPISHDQVYIRVEGSKRTYQV